MPFEMCDLAKGALFIRVRWLNASLMKERITWSGSQSSVVATSQTCRMSCISGIYRRW